MRPTLAVASPPQPRAAEGRVTGLTRAEGRCKGQRAMNRSRARQTMKGRGCRGAACVAYFLGPVPTGRIALRPPPQPPHKAAQPASESWGLLLLLWAAAARAAAATCDEHAAVHGHQQLSALPVAPANSYSASGAKQTAEGMQRAEMCCKRKDMCGARRALQRCCH